MKFSKFIKSDYNYIPFLMLYVVPILFSINQKLSFIISIIMLIVYFIYWFLVTKVYLKIIKDKKRAIRTSMRDHSLLLIAIAINYWHQFFTPEGIHEVNFLIIIVTIIFVLPKCITCFKMHQNDNPVQNRKRAK